MVLVLEAMALTLPACASETDPHAMHDDAGAPRDASSEALLGTGGASGSSGTAGSPPSGGNASGGVAVCDDSGACLTAADSGDATSLSLDGSDCGEVIDGYCAPGCIRIFGTFAKSTGVCTQSWIGCARSCEDDGAELMWRVLPDGSCKRPSRSCGAWMESLQECTDPNCSGTPTTTDVTLQLESDGGNPCAFDQVFYPAYPDLPYPFKYIRIQDLLGTQTQLLERASLDDCADRDGFFVDWSIGSPKFVLCPATCEGRDAGILRFIGAG